jgi:hypothetical protein
MFVGAADPATHKIYIWDISNDGQLASALDGGREPLLHVHVISIPILLLNADRFNFTIVASAEAVNCFYYKPGKHSYMAQSDS